MIFLGCLVGQLALLAMATDVLGGHAGRIGLAGVFYAAVGGYTYALATQGGMAPWLGVGLVIAVATITSPVLGEALLKLRGDLFLLATFALQLTFVDSVRNFHQAGAALGIPGIPSPPVPFVERGSPTALVLAWSAALVALWLLSTRLGPSRRLGRALWLIRDAELGALTQGLPVASLLRRSFVVHAVLAAVGGAAWVINDAYVGPRTFDLTLSITVLTVVFIGGTAGKPVWLFLGAAVVVLLGEVVALMIKDPTLVGSFQRLMFNALLIGVLLLWPRGFGGPIIERSPGEDLQV